MPHHLPQWIWRLVAGIVMLVVSVWDGAAATETRATASRVVVAMLPVSVEEEIYASWMTAANYSLLVEAEMLKGDRFAWVERSLIDLVENELTLSLRGFTDAHQSVRLGKWNRANLVVLARISLESENRLLELEVVDMAYADVLAEKIIKLPGSIKQPLAEVLPAPVAVAETLRVLLDEACLKRDAYKNQRRIGLLFFHKTNWAEVEKDNFQAEFMEVLEKKLAASKDLRLIRFPRANRAAGEVELAFMGLSESNPAAWANPADLYVWGTFTGSGSLQGELTFPRLKTALTLWNGRDKPLTFSEEIGGRTHRVFLAEKLADTIVNEARKDSSSNPSAFLRQEVSKSLYSQATAMLKEIPRYRLSPSAAENRPLFGALIHTLESACFFDPTNQAAQEELVRNRWGHEFVVISRNNRYRTQLQLSRAWKHYYERFGFESTNNFGPLASSIFPAPRNPVYYNYVLSAHKLSETVQYAPEDTPDAVKVEWRDQARAEVMERAITVYSQFRMDDRLGNIFDDTVLAKNKPPLNDPLRWQFVNVMWTNYVRYINEGGSYHIDKLTRNSIRDMFDAAGDPDGELKLFAQLTPPPPKPAVVAKAVETIQTTPTSLPVPPEINLQLLNLPRITFPPRPIISSFESVIIPKEARMTSVLCLLAHKNQFWLLATAVTDKRLNGLNRDLAADLDRKEVRIVELWNYDLETRKLSNLTALIPAKAEFNSLFVHNEQLWITTKGDGVWSLDIASLQAHRHGLADGVTGDYTMEVAKAGETLYLTSDRSRLHSWDAAASRWQALPVEPWEGARYAQGSSHVRLIGYGSWLMMAEHPVMLGEIAQKKWTNLRPQLFGNYIAPINSDLYRNILHPITAGAPDKDGTLWLGSVAGLHRISLGTQTVRNWYAPSGVILRTHHIHPNFISTVHPEMMFGTLNGARKAISELSRKSGRNLSPVRAESRLPGAVTALAHDGEFLWLAAEQEQGHALLLFHKPSEKWVGLSAQPERIHTILVHSNEVWLGMEGGNPLVRVKQQAWKSIPELLWLTDQISKEEINNRIATLGKAGQIGYAFWTSEYARTLELLQKEASSFSPWESLLVMGYCHDEFGLNQPDKARKYFQEIVKSNPDSPWAHEARRCLERLSQGGN